MTIKVTATCEWCLQTVDTTLEEPVPAKWQQEEILDVETLGTKVRTGNFCSGEHFTKYVEHAPQCFDAAAVDYKAKFYSCMNALRAE